MSTKFLSIVSKTKYNIKKESTEDTASTNDTETTNDTESTNDDDDTENSKIIKMKGGKKGNLHFINEYIKNVDYIKKKITKEEIITMLDGYKAFKTDDEKKILLKLKNKTFIRYYNTRTKEFKRGGNLLKVDPDLHSIVLANFTNNIVWKANLKDLIIFISLKHINEMRQNEKEIRQKEKIIKIKDKLYRLYLAKRLIVKS